VSDRIVLRGLRARGRHGALAAERELGQVFLVDLDLGVDTRAAAASDDLARTVDYGDVAARVADVVGGKAFDLIETLAQRIADACLEDPLVADVLVTVHKPHAPIAVPFEDVSVSIRRSRT
jgi:dihydroneopterin aldolase